MYGWILQNNGLLRSIFYKYSSLSFRPTTKSLVFFGIYVISATTFSFFVFGTLSQFSWYILQHLAGVSVLFYAVFSSRRYPAPRFLYLLWIGIVLFCLPVHLIFCWTHSSNLMMLLMLSLPHLVVMFLLLPFHGLNFWVVGLLFFSMMGLGLTIPLRPIQLFGDHGLWAVMGLGFLLFAFLIYGKMICHHMGRQLTYFRHHVTDQEDYCIKFWSYGPAVSGQKWQNTQLKVADLLEEALTKFKETISFLDDITPFSKANMAHIMRQFKMRSLGLKYREQAKQYMLLRPEKIWLDHLIKAVQADLYLQFDGQLTVSIKKDPLLPEVIYGDPILLRRLLNMAIVNFVSSNNHRIAPILIQLCGSWLSNHEEEEGLLAHFSHAALALIIAYADQTDIFVFEEQRCYSASGLHIDDDWLHAYIGYGCSTKHLIQHMLHSHYSYIQWSKQSNPSLFIVLPQNVYELYQATCSRISLDIPDLKEGLTEIQVRKRIQRLTDFHKFVAKIDGLDKNILSSIVVLLKHHFGFFRSLAGDLYYMRIVGIVQAMSSATTLTPHIIYASLLCSLVEQHKLTSRDIKSHYGASVALFVDHMVAIDVYAKYNSIKLFRHKQLYGNDHPPLFFALLFKCVMQIYDLGTAMGYIQYGQSKALYALITETIDVYLPFMQYYFSVNHVYLVDLLTNALADAQHLYRSFVDHEKCHTKNVKTRLPIL